MKLIGPESKAWTPNSKAHDELCRHLHQLPPKIVVNAHKEHQFAKKNSRSYRSTVS